MEKRTDGNVYTILFAVGMVIVVGALLATIAQFLIAGFIIGGIINFWICSLLSLLIVVLTYCWKVPRFIINIAVILSMIGSISYLFVVAISVLRNTFCTTIYIWAGCSIYS